MQIRELIVAAERRLRAVTAKTGLLHMGFALGGARHRTLGRLCSGVGIMLCLGLALASSACGPGYPIHSWISFPVTASDGQGNVLAAYQISEGDNAITYLQKLGPDGNRLWGKKGIRLDDRQPESSRGREPIESYTHIVADPDGNATFFWTFENQIFAKKLDGDGDPVWKTKRVVVGTFGRMAVGAVNQWAVATNAADTTIVWIDANRDLNFQSIDGDGNLLWPGGPVTANASHFETTSDENGNTWLMWVDASTGGIYLQVIDRAGRTVWAERKELQQGSRSVAQGNGIAICGLWLTEDDIGRVVAAWRHGGHDPLELRSCAADGEIQMSATVPYFEGDDRETLVSQVSDGSGGLFVFWSVGNVVRAQRIGPQGRMAWGENGLVVAARTGAQGTGIGYTVASDHAGGAVVSWGANAADGTVWRFQHIDSEGNRLWMSDGIPMDTSFKGGWWSATAGDGAVVLSYVTSEGLNRESHVQKVDAGGNLLWGANGIRLDDWRESGTGMGE